MPRPLGPPGPPGPPGPDSVRGTTVIIIGVLLLILGSFFAISCGIIMIIYLVISAADERNGRDSAIIEFTNIWPFLDWATLFFMGKNIGLIVAASILISAVTCARPRNMEASPGFLLCFTIYNVSCSTVQLIVALAALAFYLFLNERWKKEDKIYRRHYYDTRLIVGIVWIVISFLIYCALLGCTLPVYRYYESIRPMAVYPQQGRPITPQDA